MEIAAIETGGELHDIANNTQGLLEQKENEWAIRWVTGGQLVKKVCQENQEGWIAGGVGLGHWGVLAWVCCSNKSPSQGAASASRPSLLLSLDSLRAVGKLSRSM